MAKYILGEEGARKFKQLTNPEIESSYSLRYGRSAVLDNQYAHPYEVRWSNSLISSNGTEGGYMMWLPQNCLYVVSGYTPISSFPQISSHEISKIDGTAAWYELTPAALSAGGTWPSEFDIFLNDYLSAPTFSIYANGENGVEPIHITHINNYRPCGFVKSTIIIGAGQGKTDEHSVGLSGDSLSSSPPRLSTEYHIWHFHDNENDLSIQTLVEGNAGTTWLADGLDLVLRDQRGEQTDSNGYKNEVVYLPFQDLLDKFQDDWGNGGPGGKNPTSALNVDEQSVSKGGDGWQISSESGMLPSLHMWHFHDSAADVNNPEMCDIVLRYNPERESDQKWLRYISYEDLKAKLSSDIGGGGGGEGGGEITPDQLSAIPCWGMFAWTEKTQTIGPGGCMVGRKWYTCTTGIGSGKADALYQLRVTIAQSGSVSLAVVSDATLGQAPTTTQCWIPIYQITNHKIAADYRGAFVVPAYD